VRVGADDIEIPSAIWLTEIISAKEDIEVNSSPIAIVLMKFMSDCPH